MVALTDDQKSLLQSTLDSTGQAYLAVRANNTNISPSFGLTNPGNRLSQMMSLVQSRCSIQANLPANSTANNSSSSSSAAGIQILDRTPGPRVYLTLDAAGEACPIDLNFKISTQYDPDGGTFVSALDYAYNLNPDIPDYYSSLNDVDGIVLDGGVSMNGINTGSAHVETDYYGQIHSTTLNDIQFAVNGSLAGAMNSLNGKVLWRFEFPEFLAEFKEEYDDGKIHFTLNDEDISAQDFDNYFRAAGEPFFYSSTVNRIQP